MNAGVLYVIACAAPAVRRIRALLAAARERGFDVCLLCTPTAARWLADDIEELAELTGHPVRSTYKMPTEPDVLPPADAMLVAPLTFNTLNKWAAGISDTLALGLVNEALGKGIPIITVPYLNAPLAAHPAVAVSIRTLRSAGVTVLDRGRPAADEPDEAENDPWDLLLDALDRA